jgi:hypothetical protein
MQRPLLFACGLLMGQLSPRQTTENYAPQITRTRENSERPKATRGSSRLTLLLLIASGELGVPACPPADQTLDGRGRPSLH